MMQVASLEWQNQWCLVRQIKKKDEFHLVLTICVGNSLNQVC